MRFDDHLLIAGLAVDRSPRGLQRDAERGRLVRIAPSAYVQAERWSSLRADERLHLKVIALTARRPEVVLSHSSAALIHGLQLALAPSQPEIRRIGDGRSGGGVRRRSAIADGAPVEVGGRLVVPVQRTLVDLAASLPFREALAPLDGHLRDGGRTEPLLDLLRALPIRGARRAERAILSADARSANAGESFCRGTIVELGFPRPELQVPTPGLPYETDFGWREHRLRGELDGFRKYADPRYSGGRAAAEVVVAEKRREDAIRLATGDRFVRWSFEDALRVDPLRQALLLAGPPHRRR